jgi:exonuclease I
MIEDETSVDAKLYDGFIPDPDKKLSEDIRNSDPDELMSYEDKLADERLKKMLLLYKGRNYKKALSPDEHERWENYRKNKLLSGGEKSQFACFGKKLEEYAANSKMSEENKYLIEELKLYGLGIRPED